MEKIKILSLFFIAAVITMVVGIQIYTMEIDDEWKGIILYVCACVVAYVLYVISGEAKREDLDAWEDEE
ncbi:hypothetical protein CTH30272_02123 [Allocatenococcus thiocycli]|nr:hypothetical protein CTH30272_02123 [Catenococcus thiocycli]